MYFHMNKHHKKVMKSQKKMFTVKVTVQRYSMIYLRAPLKMQEIMK